MTQADDRAQDAGGAGKAARHPAGSASAGQQAQAAGVPVPRDFLKVREPILHRVVIAGLLVVVLLVTVIWAGVSAGIISGTTIANSSQPEATALTTHGFLEVTVRAEGWDAQGSTPAIARLRPVNSTEYVVCSAVPADTRDTIELDEGSYYLSWITPVDADGTLYIPPEEELIQIRAGHATSDLAVFTRVPLAESTFNDYAATIDIVYEAIEHGDETLEGEAGDALMHKLQVNANEAPNFYIFIPDG